MNSMSKYSIHMNVLNQISKLSDLLYSHKKVMKMKLIKECENSFKGSMITWLCKHPSTFSLIQHFMKPIAVSRKMQRKFQGTVRGEKYIKSSLVGYTYTKQEVVFWKMLNACTCYISLVRNMWQ